MKIITRKKVELKLTNYTVSEDEYVICIKPIDSFEINNSYKINTIMEEVFIFLVINIVKHSGYNFGQLRSFTTEEFEEYFIPKKELRRQKLDKINESRR